MFTPRSSVSTFEVLADQLQIILKGLLEGPAQEDDSQISQESKHFYQSCVNMSQIVRVGDTPLRASLEDLGGWPLTFLDRNWTAPPSLEVTVALIRKVRPCLVIFLSIRANGAEAFTNIIFFIFLFKLRKEMNRSKV